ncbi:hypothetical protein CTI12_AA228690 [Artemisia annua]|uniref:Uncharacterized protein n=1 Tax=Artemisia annua TaxID=35608 RepID=A0A2U1NTS0_ARTAN|nr:hypothetical protein CTI12_AA228690 [Artemisia annua]
MNEAIGTDLGTTNSYAAVLQKNGALNQRCYQNVLIGFLEGGTPSRISAAKDIVEAGIALMENVGLTCQAINVLDGFRPQTENVPSGIKNTKGTTNGAEAHEIAIQRNGRSNGQESQCKKQMSRSDVVAHGQLQQEHCDASSFTLHMGTEHVASSNVGAQGE